MTAPSTSPAIAAVDCSTAPTTDAAWLAQLVEQFHRSVYGYVAARVGIQAADDVTAETFLAALAARGRFDAGRSGTALPWLLGIATRRIGRHRNDERRWLRDRVAGAAPDLAADEILSGADSRLDAAALGRRVAVALVQLSRRERDPLLLHVIGGLPYEDVATALDLPIGTVRSRISRARSKLAGMLDGVAR
ncbi:MAG: sigma-70 family polymerase sigma factor [Thermoleophilia bacterium]|nr:sigma-70 family polymerase sigma factor [Thermoleophilia bacterium]